MVLAGSGGWASAAIPTGIRERVRLRKPQRATHSSWSFHQLGAFIAYRARRAGVPVVYVDPAYTSRWGAEHPQSKLTG